MAAFCWYQEHSLQPDVVQVPWNNCFTTDIHKSWDILNISKCIVSDIPLANLTDGIPIKGGLFTYTNYFQENWKSGDIIMEETIILYSWSEDSLSIASESELWKAEMIYSIHSDVQKVISIEATYNIFDKITKLHRYRFWEAFTTKWIRLYWYVVFHY